jgi:putative component of membrane protein insertase Oxa1/YidC/SpoIIIJ protein YidD
MPTAGRCGSLLCSPGSVSSCVYFPFCSATRSLRKRQTEKSLGNQPRPRIAGGGNYGYGGLDTTPIADTQPVESSGRSNR